MSENKNSKTQGWTKKILKFWLRWSKSRLIKVAEILLKMADARLKWPVIGKSGCYLFSSDRCQVKIAWGQYGRWLSNPAEDPTIYSILGESGWLFLSTLTDAFESVLSLDFLKGLFQIRPRIIELGLKATVNESYVKLILLVDISKLTFDSIRFWWIGWILDFLNFSTFNRPCMD